MSSPPPVSIVEAPGNEELPKTLSRAKKMVLLAIFCLAQFLDSFNTSALFSAIPSLEISLNIAESQSAWIISAFQLTFASFLLISGRISDVYSPKAAFISGVAGLGVISLGAGFADNKIVILTLRALIGISAAMTIPSALTLLVKVFPDPLEQARAIGVFGGCGAVANGAIFVEYASWHWVFWFVAIVALPVALGCIFVIPPQPKPLDHFESQGSKFKRLDIVGVVMLTIALILFVFAVTSGSANGWGTAMVLAPLVISILLIGGFIYWETLLPANKAAIPPRTWFYKNFSVLFATALLPYFWWNAVYTILITLWQNIYHWPVISSVIHMFPIGVLAFAMSFTGSLSRVLSPKWIILAGLGFLVIATTLIAVGGGPNQYWPFIFPAFVIGSAGSMLIFTHANIAIFQAAPPSMAGTVGAIFNGALQFGSAIGLAAMSSIQTSVEDKHGGSEEYSGRAAAFWFLLAVVCVEAFAVLVFYRTGSDHLPQTPDAPASECLEK
ncbi:hypothetical protein SERLA73DRAFT_75140 [Serpula lacrymans var. lacrymans S7.3]|uniref:Major facilitator superfamily (MFS) profile domain-containing protein n=1 Tax=Serpula lacrymans var. lacrymans (strain S7.3) TaxID=936435 RepID=F8Q2P9_SERL3|nr:hypothetical protein SERLA73DRAFT_75140 [Serpula lacrymans var. lacrymans S7.3]